MPTTVTKSIGSAGRDYPDLASWAAGLPADLTAGSGNDTVQVGQCYNDSEFSSATTLLTLSGHTTDATHTITLTAASGQSFRDDASAQTNPLRYDQTKGVGIKLTAGSYGVAVEVSDSNVFISKLQITGNPAGLDAAIHAVSVNIVIDWCILEGSDRGSGYGLVSLGTGGKIRNSLIADRRSGDSRALVLVNGAAAYGCTIVAPSDLAVVPTNGIQISYAGNIVENCAIFGFTNASDTTSGVTFTNCMTDATGTTGLTGGKTYASQFQNTLDATRDYRAKAGADLLDAGTTDATNGTPDIVGTARPQGSAYDIGAWELVAAAPPVTGPSNVYFDTIF